MKCTYEDGKLIFEDVNDGNYVLITNGIKDLSLYQTDAFKELEVQIGNLISESKKENTKRMSRYIFANAESVNLIDGVMILPSRIDEYIYSDEFDVEKKATHLRLVGSKFTKDQVGRYDIIEKMLKDY